MIVKVKILVMMLRMIVTVETIVKTIGNDFG